MNDDRDNSNIQPDSDDSSTEVNSSSEKKNIPAPEQSIEPDQEANSFSEEKNTLASEQSIEPDQEDPINKDSSVKSRLLLLMLLIALGTGFYFYTYNKEISFFRTLAPQLKNLPDIQSKETLARPPEEVIKKFEETTSPDRQSKEIPAKFSGKIIEQTKMTNLFGKTTNENEKTIDLLRDEIESLKAELKQKSSLSQNFQIKKPHISGNFLKEKPEETTQLETKESQSTIITLPTTLSPAQGKPLKQQNFLQKKSPQKRSEEVQAYLDFVENTGKKLVELIEKGWTRLQELVMNYRRNN